MNPRILIVENDYTLAQEFQLRIKKYLGLTNIDICAYGEEALERAKNPDNFPHFYIMDIGLKGELTGLEAAKQIREITPDAKFIYISGHASLIDMTKKELINLAKNNEDDDTILLVKPFDTDELIEKVDYFLSKSQLFFKQFLLKNSIFIYKNNKSTNNSTERVRIKAEDILLLKTSGGMTDIYTIHGEKHNISGGLVTIMSQWRKHVSEGNLPNSLHRVNKNYAVNILNLERYGSECGIKIKNYNEALITLSDNENYCPHFEDMLIKIMSRE